MKTTTTAHFALAHRFFQLQARHLLDALRESGIEDEDTQRTILESYLFSLANDFDQSLIREADAGNAPRHPTLCFRDSVEIGEAGELVIPDGADDLHENLPFLVVEEVLEG